MVKGMNAHKHMHMQETQKSICIHKTRTISCCKHSPPFCSYEGEQKVESKQTYATKLTRICKHAFKRVKIM